jgi:hypothetical protein
MQEIYPISNLSVEEINDRLGVIQGLIDHNLAYLSVGSYVGDGTWKRKITGFGFTPKATFIYTISTFDILGIVIGEVIVNHDGLFTNCNTKGDTFYYVALG